jgi:hypothetical protein
MMIIRAPITGPKRVPGPPITTISIPDADVVRARCSGTMIP